MCSCKHHRSYAYRSGFIAVRTCLLPVLLLPLHSGLKVLSPPKRELRRIFDVGCGTQLFALNGKEWPHARAAITSDLHDYFKVVCIT